MGRGQPDWRAQHERFARAETAAQERERRAWEREQRAAERAQAADEKKAEQLRKQGRAEEADAETAALEVRVHAFQGLLVDGVRRVAPLRLSALRQVASGVAAREPEAVQRLAEIVLERL